MPKIQILPILAAVVLILAASGALSAQEPEAEPLFDALRKNKVKFEAIAMHGFQKIDITLFNLTDGPLLLDPAGSMLMPPDPALQRLGLGSPVGAKPGEPLSFFIRIEPKARWSGCVWSVCLDAKLAVPANGVPYTLSVNPASGRALEILRYWARKPWIDQKTVNDLIWTGQSLAVLRTQVIPLWLRKSTLASWGNERFWLSGEGRLYRRKGEKWELLGKGLERIHVGEGLVAGTHRAVNGVRYRGLTGQGWQFLILPGIPEEVWPAPGFVLYAKVENQLFRFDPGTDAFVKAAEFPVASVAIRRQAKGHTLFAVRADTGKIQVRTSDDAWKEFSALPAKNIAVSQASVYAEFGTGIFRFTKKWVKLAEPGWELRPGRKCCYFLREGKVLLFSEERGKLSEIPAPPAMALSICVDPSSDLLLALDESGIVWAYQGQEWVKQYKIASKTPEVKKREGDKD